MKKQYYSLFFLIAIFSSSMYAQSPCGTSQAEFDIITKRLIENKKTLASGAIGERSGAITYVPVKFHLVSKTNGTQALAEEEVLEQLDRLNENYLDQEIQFYIDGGFNYIMNDAAFDDPSSGAAQILFPGQKVFGRVNIFITKNATTGSQSVGVTLGFYSPTNDWIVIKQSEVLNRTSTLSHEMGHFLSLLHPHNGWDNDPYDSSIHTPTPTTSPGGVLTENEARSGSCKNCDTAGDFLCDTPPDYLFGLGYPTCNYNEGTLDPCGEVVDPQEDNYMGYFEDCGEYQFTPMQKALMEIDLAARKNNGTINKNLTPDHTATVEGDIQVNFPAIGGTSSNFETVYFDWNPVPNATDYILVVSRFSTFNPSIRKFVTGGNSSILIEDPFLADTEYFWKIYPYNQTSTGYGFSETYNFTTGGVLSTNGIDAVKSIQLEPNLVSQQTEVYLNVAATNPFDAQIQILNIAGKSQQSTNHFIGNGDNRISLDISSLSNGMYIVNIQSEEGLVSKKLIVNRN